MRNQPNTLADRINQKLKEIRALGWTSAIDAKVLILLSEAVDALEAYRSENERLNKCCAEMRDLLVTVRQQVLPGLDLPAKYGVWFHSATSTECGKDYVHRDSIKPAQSEAKERELERLNRVVSQMRSAIKFPTTVRDNAEAIAYHLSKKEPFGGLDAEGLERWVRSIADMMRQFEGDQYSIRMRNKT